MLGWKKHKLESTLQGEISITSDVQMTPPLWQKAKRNLIKVKQESEKTDLKLNILLPYNPAITLRGIYPNGLKPNPHENLHMDA